MKRKLGIQHAVFWTILTMAGAVQAGAISEQEPNSTAYMAQQIDTPEAMTISAVLGTVTGAAVDDLDFYKFYGQQGDVVDIDVDGAWGGLRTFNSIVAIFDAGPGLAMLRLNNDAYPIDPGSVAGVDARIDKFVLPATGYYIVGVSGYPRFFQSGGTVQNASNYYQNGDYQLIISGVTPQVVAPQVIYINIDIKPGSGEYAPINPKAKGKVPVGLLSSPTFNALLVDKTSLTFGATGDEQSLHSCGDGEDVNGDGFLDLVCRFENRAAGFAKGDLEGMVRGKTLEGVAIEGHGLLKVVPEKPAN